MTKEQLDYLSSRSPVTPDYLPYSYQRTAPYLLWDELSSQQLSAHSTSSSPSSLSNCCCCRTGIIAVAIIILCGLFALVGIAIYLGIITNKSLEETPIDEETYNGRLRVVSGDRYSPGLADKVTPEFKLKAQAYESLLNSLYKQSVIREAYIKSQVVAFENGSLIVYFRLHLDRRKLSSDPVKAAYDVLYYEVASDEPKFFRLIQVELKSLNISGIAPNDINRESVQQSQQHDDMDTINEHVTNSDYNNEQYLTNENVVTNEFLDETEPSLSAVQSTEASTLAAFSLDSLENVTVTSSLNSTTISHRVNGSLPSLSNGTITSTSGTLTTPLFSYNTSSWKGIPGIASEVSIDWKKEEGVSGLFSNDEDMLYAEADNSHEFGSRIKPPPDSNFKRIHPIHDQPDDSVPVLHAESPTLAIVQPSTRFNENFYVSKSQRPLIKPVIKARSTTLAPKNSPPWRPISYPWRHHVRDSLETTNDEQVGFGLRLRPHFKQETVLHNQSSQAFIVRLPPRTRKPLSFNEDAGASSHAKWQQHRQTRMQNSDEEDGQKTFSSKPASELEARVIPNKQLNANEISYSSTKNENKAKGNDANNPIHSKFDSEASPGDKWRTSVSVQSSTSIALGKENELSALLHDVPSTLIITSIVTSVEEVSGETTPPSTAVKIPLPTNSSIETYSVKEYFFQLFPELVKLSDVIWKSSQEQMETSEQPNSTSVPETVKNSSNTKDVSAALLDHTLATNSTSTDQSAEHRTQKFDLLDLLDINNVTEAKHILSATQTSSAIPMFPEETRPSDIPFNEPDEESNFLLSTKSEEVKDEETNLLTTLSSSKTPLILATRSTPLSVTTSASIKRCNSPTLFHCGSGECVSIFSRCNRMKDCADNSDENGCTCADFIRANVMNSTLCDGVIDCWDYSDESECDWCSPSMFICPNSARVCISREKVCDGFSDCPGGEDERSCVTVAPNMTAADSGIYWGGGLVMIKREGRWGKLCMENFENFVSETQVATGDLGRVLCHTMGYSDLQEAKQLQDLSREARNNETFYYEPQYSKNESNSRSSSIQFVSTPCHSKEVIRVKCKNFDCGKRHHSNQLRGRIVGGSNSTLGSWPWQAAVYKEGNFMCGATLISQKWLLSAAHCFYQAVDHYWAVRLGVLRRGSFSPYERVHRLSHIILHSNYISSNFVNDIALLLMAEPVAFSDYIRPICLPNPEATQASINRKQLCTVVGWGQTNEEGDYLPDVLQEVKLPLISAEECRKRTTALTSYTRVNGNMFCAGMERGGRDACLGDSGGPIMCQENEGHWALTGITSNGFGCARASRPGIYTKVASYLKWIQKTMDDSLSRPIRSGCNGHRCLLGKCLSKRQVCDGFVDCMEGSDEQGCRWPQRI